MSGPFVLPRDIQDVFKAERAVPNRLIHLVPDELAKAVPEHPIFSLSKSPHPKDGFTDVSAKSFANAINRASWYLRSTLGPPRSFDSVCYMGPNDIRYFILMFAAIKVGYKMVFTSPRNHVEGHLNVLEGSNCHLLLHAENYPVDHILSRRPMFNCAIPSLLELLHEKQVALYPYTKTFEEARADPALVLHTTGSTGLPKPIVWKVGILSTYEAWRTIPPVQGFVPTTVIYQQAKRMYMSLPLFHTSGLNAGITWGLLLGVTLVYGVPSALPNATLTDRMHEFADVDASIGAPSLYEELSRDDISLSRFRKLKYVVASGAPLSLAAGSLISPRTRIVSNLGATETACLQRLSPSIEDWDYFHWHPTHSGIQMRPYMDDLYELFLVKQPDLELFQGIFITFPEITEWSMSDLYERHPDPKKSFLFRYKGRRDDVIVLSNGEKIVPALMEATLNSSPLVKGSMVVGRGRFHPAVLIDLGVAPPADLKEQQILKQKLLPFIEEANQHAPAHGQLDQYHVLFADPERPIRYLGQGKIQRYSTHEIYAEDISKLYEAVEIPLDPEVWDNPTRLDLSCLKKFETCLHNILTAISGLKDLDSQKDLFELGLDSLHVLRLARELRLEGQYKLKLPLHTLEMFAPRHVYSRPKLASLATFLYESIQTALKLELRENIDMKTAGGPLMDNKYPSIITEAIIDEDVVRKDIVTEAIFTKAIATEAIVTEAIITEAIDQADQANQDQMTTLLNQLGQRFTSLPTNDYHMKATQNRHVLLTGSTGSLGSYILDELIKDREVENIVCLNRSGDAANRQRMAAIERGLSPIDSSRVQFMQADLSKDYFGLDEDSFDQLQSSVTHIIHNQWPVNFHWPLASFEPHIRGVANLAQFATASRYSAFLLFVSSVSAVDSLRMAGGVPERTTHDLSAAADSGYAQSKLIAESLLDKASTDVGLKTACCRVGIVAGPVDSHLGMWNVKEYVPSIIVSSAHMQAFPTTFPGRDNVDWLPVDRVSKVLVEIMTSVSQMESPVKGTEILHVVNPCMTSWESTISPSILSAYASALNVKAMPFESWVELLEQKEFSDVDVKLFPAVRLLDFYRSLAGKGTKARRLLCNNALSHSATLAAMEPVNATWLRNWMMQWGLLGDLPEPPRKDKPLPCAHSLTTISTNV